MQEKNLELLVGKEKCIAFLDLIGDYNPIHRKDNIVSGMYLYSELARLLGKENYLKQELKFRKPIFYGDKIRLLIYPCSENMLETKAARENEIVLEGKAFFGEIKAKVEKDLAEKYLYSRKNLLEDYTKFCKIIECEESETSRKVFLSSMLVGTFAGELFSAAGAKPVFHAAQTFDFLYGYIPDSFSVYEEERKEKMGLRIMKFLLKDSRSNVILMHSSGTFKELT